MMVPAMLKTFLPARRGTQARSSCRSRPRLPCGQLNRRAKKGHLRVHSQYPSTSVTTTYLAPSFTKNWWRSSSGELDWIVSGACRKKVCGGEDSYQTDGPP